MKNIILVVLDSLRADKVKISDKFDFFKEAIYFKAVSNSVWTPPSHATMFTGLYPSEHEVITYSKKRSIQLSKDIKTLPEILKDKGYSSCAVSNNPWLADIVGLKRGFDVFLKPDMSDIYGNFKSKLPLSLKLISVISKIFRSLKAQILLSYLQKKPVYTRTTLQNSLQWIYKQAEKNNPFFMFMNLMDAHQPYYPPKDILSKYTGDKRGFLRQIKDNLAIRQIFHGDNIVGA